MDIEKIFRQEIQEKKRIGSNIFSRVSTRKGGSNQALRTPYLYMSRKERKQLNGDVRVYNMNDILDYDTFESKGRKEQKELMTHWRQNFKSQEIQNEMGISRTVFYKILRELDIPRDYNNFKRYEKVVLSDDELDSYTKEFIPFEKYRTLVLEQQSIIIESYINEYGGVRAVKRLWEGADEGYMYSIRSRYNKMQKENDSLVNENEQSEMELEVVDYEKVDESSLLTQEEKIKNAMDLLTDIGYSIKGLEENAVIPKAGRSNIEVEADSFSFNLSGMYNAKTIKKRLELVLEFIEDEDELFNLDIKISKN